MAIEINDELVLNHSESIALLSRLIHPDIEAIRLRDAFLQGIEAIDVVFSDDEITAVCPDICLPTRGRSLYDEKPLEKSEAFMGAVHIEQGYEFDLFSDSVFMFEKQECPPMKPEREKWTVTDNASQWVIMSAA